jgi:acetoin utilization deacetylase AcuC-like enzyme
MLRVAWAPEYVLPLSPHHRFPMSKYELLPQQLMYEGTLSSANFFTPVAETRWANLTHDAGYLRRLQDLALTPKEIRRTGFPLTAEVIQREYLIASGTVQCTRYALQHGIAMNIAGGTHHAFADRGEGFCLLNDLAMAAHFLLHEKLARSILMVDLDVHQGNGTAHLFQQHPSVFTFSMHGANNYPLHKESSDLDIGLPDRTPDDFYLKTLEHNLHNLMDHVQPDFLFYQAGVDILVTDKLGKLSVTREGCKQRDRLVLEMARRHSVPLVVTMGGGYSERFSDIIEAHANTYRLAQEIFF